MLKHLKLRMKPVLYCQVFTVLPGDKQKMQSSHTYFMLHLLSFPLFIEHSAVICKSQLFPLLISTGVELVSAETACDLFLLLLPWSEL